MGRNGVVSADSHMTEPVDLWTERIDARFRDRAPKVVENETGKGARYLFIAEGAPPFPIAGGFAAGRSGKELQEIMDKGYEAARPSGGAGSIADGIGLLGSAPSTPAFCTNTVLKLCLNNILQRLT